MKGQAMAAKEHYMAGLGKLGAGDWDGAIAHFQQALAEDASFYMAHLGWSQALDRQGQVDAAIDQAKKAIALVSDEPLAHTSLSRLYQQKGMIAEAEQELAISKKLSEIP